MNQEINLFSYVLPKFKIDRPVRLIELFAGIGSQAKALKRLNIDFTHHKVIEWDKYAIASYNAIHGTSFETSDITKVSAAELEITERERFIYIMTYSFPCQDLSLAGKGKGMSKGSGTRSGLLWEVERLLDELNPNLPHILMMENVPQVIGKQNIKDFQLWRRKLEELGYSNYVQLLNAKHYGIPQNRNRCFMISILGNYYYDFPKKQKLKLKLKDMLETDVDEKYYLSQRAINGMLNSQFHQTTLEARTEKNGIIPTLAARDYKDPKLHIETKTDTSEIVAKDTLKIKENTKKGYAEATGGDGVYINRPHQKRGVVQKGMIQTIKTSCEDIGVVIDEKQSN